MQGQLNIFDMMLPKLQIDRPIRLIELFAGIGSQAMALRDLGEDFEHYRISEWEVNANRSYKAIHMPDDNTDYSKKYKKFKWVARVLYEYGISADGKTRLALDEIKRRGEKWVRQTYNEFRATHNIGSITNAHALDLRMTDTDRYCYIMIYSFPCQDLSVAGRQKGMTKGSGTRSGLLWEVERILSEVENLPQVLIMENVPQVHNQANMPDFQKWINFLESKGYSNYWQDLNAKDYGVAQNRDRCFMVSILGEWNYRFPEPVPLEKTMKDYLEDEADEKYYINTEKAQKLIRQLIDNGTLDSYSDFEMENNFNQRGKVHGENSICRTILGCGHAGNEPKVLSACQKSVGNGVIERKKEIKLGNIYGYEGGNYAGNIYDKENLAPTISTMGGGNRQPMIVAMRGRNPDNPSDSTAGSPTEQRLEPNSRGICNALTSVQKDNLVIERLVDLYNSRIRKDELCGTITSNGNTSSTHCGTFGVIEKNTEYRIRKLMPLECWRLMGFSDEDFRKAEKVNSNSQLYKQAGNSIVKNVLAAIFGQMLPDRENKYKKIR